MTVLITGSTGILGSAITEYLTQQGESIIRFDRKEFRWADIRANSEKLNEIDCIIHAAANTNVESCELDSLNCYKDNTLLTERLAYAASLANCKFVYISSTGIYGTEKPDEPYTEYDIVNPTTHHHRAKWLGEQAVNRYLNNALILRAGWVFGGEPDNSKNFVARRIEEALSSSSKKIQSNSQQKGVPTYAFDIAQKLYELLNNDEVGTFNIVNQGVASRFDYVSKIIQIAQLDVTVLPTSAGTFNRKAKVSNNESAVALKLQQLGYEALPCWKESLEKYINVGLHHWLINKKEK